MHSTAFSICGSSLRSLQVLQWTTLNIVLCFSLEVHSWIICDGDIDPEWIESLNSVLDDNRLLTMPSGERIQFGPNVNFVFETHDLSCASPATISRMGMIFLRWVNLAALFNLDCSIYSRKQNLCSFKCFFQCPVESGKRNRWCFGSEPFLRLKVEGCRGE